MKKFWDGDAFVYTDYKVKFIVKPNYSLKMRNGKKEVVNLVTAGKVTDKKEFLLTKYEKI